MQTIHTFSVLFWLKLANKKDNKAPLYARITVNGRRAEISLKRKVTVSDWDTSKSRIKGFGIKAKQVNNYLDGVCSRLFDCYQKLKDGNKLISPQLIKAHFLGNGENRYTISDIIEYHKKHMKDTLRWGTQKNYFTTHKYIFLFLKQKHRTTDIFLSELNYKFIIDFERFLRHQKDMGNNTVMKHIERLRKLINLAHKMEWLDKDPFIKFKAKYIRKERAYLTSGELQTIEQKQFTIERLQLIKDLFVFSCYTGLSYGDVMNLTKDSICIGIDGKQWISSYRQKTSIPVRIPLLPKALDIINSYKDHPSSINKETLFPTISNQKLNSYLKEIADVCHINKNLTFHIARHTFATTVTLSNGVPIETVSKLLGHSKITTTQIYAKVIERKVSEDMQRLEGCL
ncbi:site-specific integrase [Muricauda sp. SCSIO 64092]|uniref:site-specific integrase n=1 Tax=Allomuricauda sp. SCSIO 64092 TaxID=2908842 RepID=UPI001FF24B07|nr:site-specific integrase [Muricauda sp. SCSIO 64092]UOY05786.1 site-specific integrase [Muricauda sp. SCSIO 64092]